MSRSPLVVLVAAASFLSLTATAAPKPRPRACPGGRFVIPGAPLITGSGSGGGPSPDVVIVGAGRVTISSGCTATRATLKAGKRATTVAARWRSCSGIRGPARLRAQIVAPACDVLTGTLVTPRARPKTRPVAGGLTRCGDGVVDPAGGETCDPGRGGSCPASARCTGAAEPNPCRCVALAPATVPATTTTTSTTTTSTTTTAPPAPLAACRAAVRSGALSAAATACAAAALSGSAEAQLLAAVTGLPAGVLQNVALRQAAAAYGFVLAGSGLPSAAAAASLSGEVCGFLASHPGTVPAGAPGTAGTPDLLRREVLPLVDATIARLSDIPADARVMVPFDGLPACLRVPGGRSVEVDHGDVLAARGALQVAAGLVELASAWDVGVDVADVVNNRRTPLQVFAANPKLLTLGGGRAGLDAARARLDAGFADLVAVVDSIVSETDDQSDDLLVIDPAELAPAARARAVAVRVRQALSGTAVFEAATFGISANQRLDLSALFDGLVGNVRPLVPAFDAAGNPDPCQIADPMFFGMAPDMTTPVLRSILRLRCP